MEDENARTTRCVFRPLREKIRLPRIVAIIDPFAGWFLGWFGLVDADLL